MLKVYFFSVCRAHVPNCVKQPPPRWFRVHWETGNPVDTSFVSFLDYCGILVTCPKYNSFWINVNGSSVSILAIV